MKIHRRGSTVNSGTENPGLYKTTKKKKKPGQSFSRHNVNKKGGQQLKR